MRRHALFLIEVLSVLLSLIIFGDCFAKTAKIAIEELSALQFTAVVAGTNSQSETVLPEDAGAAEFNITGEPLQVITVSILGTMELSNKSDKIPIDAFYFGGGLDSSGIGTIDASGNLNSVKIGASITVPANPTSGIYDGQFKLRAVYQ